MSSTRDTAMADINTELINASNNIPQADPLDYEVPTPEPPVGIFPSEEAGTPPRASLRERLLLAKKVEDENTPLLDRYRNAYKAFGYRVQGNVSKASDFLTKLPMPGGIIVPLMILIILMFILIAYNGNNRLTWLWLTFIGKARVQGSQSTTTQAGISCGTTCVQCSNNPFQCCATDGVSPCNTNTCPVGCQQCTNAASSSLSCCSISSGGTQPCTSTTCPGGVYSQSLGICETNPTGSGPSTLTNPSNNGSILNSPVSYNPSTGQVFSYVDFLGSAEYG